MKVWESPFISSHLTFKKVSNSLTFSQSITQQSNKQSNLSIYYNIPKFRILGCYTVDVWSNSSRCRIISVYLSQTWCLYTWSCLHILIIMHFSINCSTVICSPTVKYLCSWEKPLVKLMAPGSIFVILIFQYLVIFIAFIFLCIFIIKIPKILSYHIYQISLS